MPRIREIELAGNPKKEHVDAEVRRRKRRKRRGREKKKKRV